MHFDCIQWHKMPTHSPHTFLWSVRTPVSSTGWAAIQPRVWECVLSAGSQSPACVSSAQSQSQGPKNSRSRGTRGQINSEAAYSILGVPAEILLIIEKKQLFVAPGNIFTRTSFLATWKWHAVGSKMSSLESAASVGALAHHSPCPPVSVLV